MIYHPILLPLLRRVLVFTLLHLVLPSSSVLPHALDLAIKVAHLLLKGHVLLVQHIPQSLPGTLRLGVSALAGDRQS